MSCENLSEQLNNLQESLPQNSLDRILAINLMQRLKMECQKFPSSLTATVSRSLISVGLSDDKANKFANKYHERAQNQVQNFLDRHKT